MKKILGLLGTIMITGNAIPSVIAAAPNRKHSIKKRQTRPTNEENQQTKTRTSNYSQDGHSATEFIEKEITLNENYSHNIQKILQELIKNNQLDPLRMINNEGIVRTDYFETQNKRNERENNIKIIEKLDEILELKKFDASKIRILVLTLKNKENNKIKLIINLDNLYLQGFINENNEYFYFDDELLEKIKQNNQEEIIKLNDLRDKLNNLKDNKLLFNEEKVKEYLQQKNKIIPLKEKEKNNKKLNYNNEINYLNKKIIILCGESLKTEEIKTKTLNTKVTEKYNCQKINLNYTGAYSENGLDVVIKEKGKPNRVKDIIISRDTLNNAIANLAKFNNDKNQNQTTKDYLVRMIFITSEAMRFGSHLKYFNYEKDGEEVEFKNIPKDIQNIINSTNDDKIQWKNYSEQLIGGWVASSKYVEEKRIEIFKELNYLIYYFEVLNNLNNNENKFNKLNWDLELDLEGLNLGRSSLYNFKFDEEKINSNIKINEYLLNKIKNIDFDKDGELWNQILFKKVYKIKLEKLEEAKKIIEEEVKNILINPSLEELKNTQEKVWYFYKKNIVNILNSQFNIDWIKEPKPTVNFKLFYKEQLIKKNIKHNGFNVFLNALIINKNYDILKLIISKYIYKINKTEFLVPFLSLSVLNDDLKVTKLFLESGFNVNIKDIFGNTPLHLIIIKNSDKKNFLEIIKLLLAYGANPNIKDNSGFTPLYWAITEKYENKIEIIKLLLAYGADVNQLYEEREIITALSLAILKRQRIEIIKLLLAYGADVDNKNYNDLIDIKNPPNSFYFELSNNFKFVNKSDDYKKIKYILEEFKKIKQKIEKDLEILRNLSKKLTQEQKQRLENKIEKRLEENKKEIKELLGEAFVSILSIFVENHNLREISDNSKETILNAFIEKNKKLKKLFSIGQLYVTNITNDSAIINSPSPNTYTGTVPVTFTIKKEIQHNKSQKTIIENEYKKQGARPKGSKMIPNQPSNTDNSKPSIGGGESSIEIQQQNTMYDVPADNSCLFWAVATAYLLPVRNNNEEFKNRFIQLFGEENLKYLQLIQKLLKQYDLENNRNLNQLWYQNQIANNLVTNVFRNRVVDYIRGNLDNPTQINSQINQIETFRSAIQISENEININNYLERMRHSSSWGGQLEILAIGNLIGSNINVNNRNIFETNNPNAKLQIFHVNQNHYNFILLQNTNEENIINSQEKNTDIQKQQKLTEAEKPKTNITILNKPTVNNNTNLSVNKPIKINIANSQETTIKKAINKYNALSKEEKQQKLNEINQHYQSLPENEQKAFKDKLRDVGLGLTSTGISSAGILGISKMTGISPIKSLSTTANYIKNSLSTTRTVVSSETGEAVEMTPLLSESTVAEDLTAAETLSVTEGSTIVAAEGAVIGTEAGTAAALLAPETLGLSLVIGGLVIAGTAILWWINSDHTIVKHESHNQYNEIEKYYKFLAHDQLKLDININEWNKIKKIYQENANNYKEFKNQIKSEITNFHKEDHSGWGGSINDEDINTLINIIYNHFEEINNHFSSNPNHGWKIITNTVGSYFIIEEE